MAVPSESVASADPQKRRSPVTEEMDKSAILQELDNILASPPFRNSSRSKQFLSFVVQHRLDGHDELLKERSIGADLFHRPADYATGDDPVVRVQAGEVRRRLEQYYHEFSKASDIRIDLPIGTYVPEFHPAPVELPVEAPAQLFPLHEPGRKWKVLASIGLAINLLLVVAQTDDGVGQFLVSTDAPGVHIEPQQSIDLVKQYARVHFDGVAIDHGAAVGAAAELVDRQAQIAQVLQCAEVVGILQTVFDFTVAWALDRHTFGRPLASYQALKHRFADMKMWLEACRATTAAAVAAISARSPDAGLSASIAKSYVGEMATDIIQGCVQMHGGIGVTWEHDLHVFLRRAALYRSMFGTPEEHNLRVYRLQEAGQRAPRSA